MNRVWNDMECTAPAINTDPVSDSNGQLAQPVSYRKRGRTKQVAQAANLQRIAYDAVLALKESCTNADTGQLVMDCKTAVSFHKLIGAWDTARDAVRILRGKGLPASVKASKGGSSSQVKPLDAA